MKQSVSGLRLRKHRMKNRQRIPKQKDDPVCSLSPLKRTVLFRVPVDFSVLRPAATPRGGGEDLDKLHQIRGRRFALALGIFTCVALTVMFLFADLRCLWYDDIYELYFVRGRSFRDAMSVIARVDMNPPLWGALTWLWVRIAPYGNTWLRLPSILFAAASIPMIGLVGKRLGGERVGLIAAFLALCSPQIYVDCAFSFRCYGLYLFLSVCVTGAYLRKYRAPTVMNRTLYIVSMILLSATHYFGALLCVFFGISDLILAIRRRQPRLFFVDYLIAAAPILPWAWFQLKSVSGVLAGFWPEKPKVKELFQTMASLLSFSPFVLVLFIVSVVLAIRALRFAKENRRFPGTFSYLTVLFPALILLYLLFVFLFSWLSPGTSLWVSRYFYCLIPLFLLTSARSGEFLTNRYLFWLAGRPPEKHRACVTRGRVLVAGALLASFTLLSAVVPLQLTAWEEPFEDVAETLNAQIYSQSDKKVLVVGPAYCEEGWLYYITEGGQKECPDITLIGADEYNKEDALQYDVVYFFQVHQVRNVTSIDDVQAELADSYRCTKADDTGSLYRFVRNAVKEPSQNEQND